MNSPQNTIVQRKNHIQTWTRSIHIDGLFRLNHKENKDEEISGMQLNVDAI